MLGLKNTAKGITFCNQNPDEKVIKVLRRGFILELGWIIPSIVIFILIYTLQSYISITVPDKTIQELIAVFLNAGILFLAFFSFNKYLNWFYSVNIITNQRIIDFEFKDLGLKNIVECQVKNIQSVSVKNEGFASFIFGLATLHILTSGDNPNIDFEFIYNSNEIQDLISDMTRGVYPK
jgi:hypothetical protein